ncbi:PIN domain nuclease [Tsukamurella sp. NPDC003166]|uniref:PIN domain nuclease n=1 Tax=Tsukamurella sp. NPDC003166 TaxID=3154444 RepID=UPI0033B6EB3B
MSGPWLIDKSALVRLADSPHAAEWVAAIHRGLVHVSVPTLLESGYSARSQREWSAMMSTFPLDDLIRSHLTPRIEDRALEVQGLLTPEGRHRAPGVPDLLIAATAELNGLTVLHVDRDFELIAEVTGQPVERLTGDFT